MSWIDDLEALEQAGFIDEIADRYWPKIIAALRAADPVSMMVNSITEHSGNVHEPRDNCLPCDALTLKERLAALSDAVTGAPK